MTDLTIKYNLLDNSSKKQVTDLMDSLISRKEISLKNRMTAYKEKIQNVSVWSDRDIKEINKNQKKFSK